MRTLIEKLESSKVPSSEDRIKWKVAFPFHSVQDKLQNAYPSIPSGSNIIPDRYDSNMEVAKKVYKKFEKYLKDVSKEAKGNDWLKGHLDLLKKADESYKKLLKGRDIRDWVNLKARLSNAHSYLYR